MRRDDPEDAITYPLPLGFTIQYRDQDGIYSNVRYYGVQGYTQSLPKNSTLPEVLDMLSKNSETLLLEIARLKDQTPEEALGALK